MTDNRKFLFLVASTREAGHVGNTEWLARQAAATLPQGTTQQWMHLARMHLPPFVDLRHTTGQYPMPEGDLKTLLDATLAATDIVLVAPVYWYSLPSTIKTCIDHWSGWLRIPGVPFKDLMTRKTLRLITTSGDRAKAQPMIDSVRLCAQFLSMGWGDALWGKGGPVSALVGRGKQPAPVHLPMQKLEKITPSRSSDVNSPVISFSAVCARRNSSASRSSVGDAVERWAVADSR